MQSPVESAQSPLLDALSRHILTELQQDARLSYAELGRRVGLSPSATSERLRRLEDAGIIRGYRLDVDPQAIGLGVTVFVRMTCDRTKYKEFLRYIESLAAVRECYHVTGNDALLLKVLLSDTNELEPLISRFLAYGIPTTSLVMSQCIARREFALLDKSR